MRVRVVLSLCCLLFTATSLPLHAASADKERPTAPKGLNGRFLDPKMNAEEWVERFEGENREIAAGREKIVKALKLQPGAAVADVGAGTGLFVEPFSAAVTDKGKVYALEISPGFVKHLKKRVKEKGLQNVEVVLSKEDSTELPEGAVDVVFVCDTYHHFEHHEEMLRSIHSALRKGGQLVVIDFERIPGKTAEWLLEHVRAGKEKFKKEIEQAGFRFQEEVKFPAFRQNYFLRFKKL